jgi:tight adherence protein B
MIFWLDAEERSRRRQLAALPLLLHGLARSLRAGMTLHAALQQAAADDSVAGEGLARAAQRMHEGAPIPHEIDGWAASLGHRDADLVRAVINTGAATGSALAVSFDRAAASLEERAGLQREISALTAQARASAVLLTLAPIAFLVVMATVDPTIVALVVSTASGRVALTLGLLLDLAGWVWMRRLTAAVDP